MGSENGRFRVNGSASALTELGPGGVGEHLRRQPSMPMGPAATRPVIPQLTEVTRRLSANAYARPNRLTDLSVWLDAKIRGSSGKANPVDASQLEGDPQQQKEPEILVGDDFNNWVRRRVAKERPLPSFGFDEHVVLGHCLRAERLRHRRRALTPLLAMPGVAIGMLRAVPWIGPSWSRSSACGLPSTQTVLLPSGCSTQCGLLSS